MKNNRFGSSFSPMGADEPESVPAGNALKDGFTTFEKGRRGSYSPWGPSGLDLKNDEPPLVHDLGDDT